jgi:acetyl-CoA acetyltransferase
MQDVFIIGLGMIRFNKYPNRDVRDMSHEAIQSALTDAELEKADVQAAFFSNTFWGMFSNQHSIRGQVVLRSMGIEKIPVTNVENACAGASTALHLAYAGIRGGMYECALVVGSEKITHPDKTKSFSAYATCMDVENFDTQVALIEKLKNNFQTEIREEETPPGQGRSIFMDTYAMMAAWHRNKFGSTQHQLAKICSKNHMHGSLNPLAQYQRDMTVEEVLSDPLISYPFTRAMCAPIGDGAAAAIICSGQYLKKIKNARPIKIRASVHGSGSDRGMDGEDIGERLAKQAYEQSGLEPKDIDLAELHDATAYGELHQTEAMGFCNPGDGGHYALSGATTLGGEKPINTSGGLECRGHPIGASGLAQIYEIGVQLRGQAKSRQVEKARLGLAENGGGNIGVEEAAMCIHILEKEK